ncbi:LPS-assembly protein LptD [Hydrogenivirga sp. 128-5-R1-1]|uniref:LPS-assembly protein LptD n=1 Tax=Hydrogenivirga sp. 128-5-R1-1 TaxID=392423 RepID=UPI00015F18BB|nr:LPS-assembly protein LptD [Hydrogenivirga sp. 128-5-R1-1]EDP75451.1 organic solvent tolerance protein [Hydrogenivirga sp. 128-5-R1-1]
MAKWLTLLLALVSLSLSAEILSKSLTRDEEGNLIAEGDVEAEYREYIIRADRVKYNPATKEVFAYGNVYVKRKDGSLEVLGKEAYIDLKAELGYFIDAEGKFRKFYFSARKIEKVGEEVYHIYDGEVTTCPPDKKELKVCFWKARVSDRYVFSFSNSLKFFRVPFFYSPVVVFPVGDRRSGLLPPMIGQNTYNNLIYIQPFYWAISRDRDATFTLDYRDKQAKGLQVEYRQAFTLKDRLYFRLSYYKEPLPPGEWWEGRNLQTLRENRFRLEFNTGFKNWKFGLDLPSDPYFFEDVYFTQKRRTVPYTLSYITYTRMERDYFLSFNLRNFYDLTSDDNDGTLNLLPEFGFYSRPKQVGSLFLNLTSTFTNFYREEGLRTQRLVFTPQVELPMKLFGMNNYAGLKLINNFYFTEGEDYPDERVSSVYFEDRLPFFGGFSWKGLSFSNVFELVYSFSPQNFNNPQLDSFDEVTKENNIKARYSSSLSYGGRAVASLFLEGGYNLLKSYRFPTDSKLVEKSLLPFRAILSLYPTEWLSLTEDATYDANLGVLARSVSSANLKVWRANLGGSYVVSRDSDKKRLSDQYTLTGEVSVSRFLMGGSVTRDNVSKRELYRKVYLGVKGACWSLTADYRRTYYGSEKGYLREVFVVFNMFNMKDFKLPLRRK